MKKLISWEECNSLSISQVHNLYRNYVNPEQVELIGSFGFGRDLVEKSEGMYFYTKTGTKVLDFTGGISVLNHGHNHPEILKARIKYQKQIRPEVHKNFLSPYIAGLSKNIASILGCDLDTSYFCNSGSEAVEGATKLAYKYHGGKRKSIARSNIAFHGKLLGSGGLTGSPELRFQFPTIPNIKTFEYDNIDSLKRIVKNSKKKGISDLYAIIIEPFNASSLRFCSKEFLSELRDITLKEDIILIYDEVYSGWAKTGDIFYFMKDKIIPDIVTYAKSFGGGKSSISGYTTKMSIFKKSYGNLGDAILHSTTYNGFGEETITAMKAIEIIIKDNYQNKSKNIYKYLNPKLNHLMEKYPKLIHDVRGSGSLNGIIIKSRAPKILKSLLQRIPSNLLNDERFLDKLITSSVISELYNKYNILTFYGDNIDVPLKVSPSLIVTKKQMDYFVDSLDKVLSMGEVSLLRKFITQKWKK